MELFRPVGLEELRLVYLSGMRGFPPRLADQPIFYPVTNEGYAAQIAREWNTTSGTLGGFVTRFEVDDACAGRFERRIVGAREHEELWVPAEELEDFNANLVGRIRVTAAYFGGNYVGDSVGAGGLAGLDVRAQLVWLHGSFGRNEDVRTEIALDHAHRILELPLLGAARFFQRGHQHAGAGRHSRAGPSVLVRADSIGNRQVGPPTRGSLL